MLGLTKFPETLKIFHKPYLLGVALAFFAIGRLWPGGNDAAVYYLRDIPANATVPAWAYLFTYPFSLVGWPLSWQILTLFSVLIISIVYALRGNNRWWLVIASAAFIYNAWWGQIEIFSVIGLAICMLVLEKRINVAWLGIAWLLMTIKPQVNYGLLLLFFWWLWKDGGHLKFIAPTILFVSVVCLTFVLFPGWFERWVITLSNLVSGEANASIWPWGLLIWPVTLLARKSNPSVQLRVVASASLLGSPYFTLHHCLTLLVLTDSPIGFLLSWIPMIMIPYTRDWAKYAWIIPLGILLYDFVLTKYDEHRSTDGNTYQDCI